MADLAAFECVCAELERANSLTRLQARGAVRLALKKAGLDARKVTPQQMGVVVDRVLPAEIESCGVAEPERVCRALKSALEAHPSHEEENAGEAPEDVFRRLGG